MRHAHSSEAAKYTFAEGENQKPDSKYIKMLGHRTILYGFRHVFRNSGIKMQKLEMAQMCIRQPSITAK